MKLGVYLTSGFTKHFYKEWILGFFMGTGNGGFLGFGEGSIGLRRPAGSGLDGKRFGPSAEFLIHNHQV
jgi:hypothetical protein